MYHVDADQLTSSSFASVTANRPTLRFGDSASHEPYQPQNADGVAAFLRHHKVAGTTTSSGTVASGRD
jgi:hypothetical protein